MAKNILNVTAFRKNQIFIFHLKAVIFNHFHYLYGIFIPNVKVVLEISDHCDYVAYMLSTAVSLSFPLSFCQTHSHPTQYDHTRKKCHVSGPMQRHVSTLQKSGVIEM